MSGAWRNAYLTIAMLKVDISRRHEVAVKMKELDKSGHEIKAQSSTVALLALLYYIFNLKNRVFIGVFTLFSE